MNDKNDEPLVDRLDPILLNEQISNDQFSNDQFFDTPAEFEAKHSQNIIDKLIHLSRFGNLLTLVVGNNGCGKTYLLDKLISSVDDSCQICHINAQPLLSIDQLFQQVIKSFAGETTFTGIPLTANQYEEWAEQLTAVPGNRLLIIDDAEVLSTSVLHELCQLSAMQQEKETPHLHLILFGNYDLNNILEQASHGVLNEDGIYAIDVPSLNDEEAKSWLEYLFNKDGIVFFPEPEDLEKMLVKGQGNFALLEEGAGEFSAISHELDELENEPEPGKVSGIGYWFGGLTILIMLVLGLFFFQKELTDLFGINDEQLPVIVKQQTVLNKTTTDESSILALENESAVEQMVDEPSASLDDQIVDTENNSQDSAQESDQERNETTTEEVNDSEVVEVNLVEENATDIAAKEESHLTQDEQLMMSFSDDDYAVQLIGLRKESDAKSFIAKYDLTKIMYYKSSLAEKPWYIVILANYNLKEDAVQARLNLSDDLLKHGPWIKSLKVIKSELIKAQKLFNNE